MKRIKITRLFKKCQTFIGESKTIDVPESKELNLVTPCCRKFVDIPLSESTKYECPVCQTQYLFELV